MEWIVYNGDDSFIYLWHGGVTQVNEIREQRDYENKGDLVGGKDKGENLEGRRLCLGGRVSRLGSFLRWWRRCLFLLSWCFL